jgi:hypothetical protein
MSTSGDCAGTAGCNSGAETQNRPCRKNKYSQIQSESNASNATSEKRGKQDSSTDFGGRVEVYDYLHKQAN